MSVLRHAVASSRVMVLTVAFAAVSGCGYTSQYSPPADGRARAVWSHKDVVVYDGGRALSHECAANLAWLTHTSTLRSLGGDTNLAPPQPPSATAPPLAGPFFVPVYVGPPILIGPPGLPPPLPPPLLVRGPRLGHGHGGAQLRPGPSFDSEIAKVFTVMAVIALAVLPAVDIAVATVPPESGEKTSEAIDQVHALNDLGRTRGTACTTEWAP